MKSKVKLVVSASEPDQHSNIWHKLEMENGDKIEIGKRKLQQVGWDLEYEMHGDEQQEFRKAKTPKKENTFTPHSSTSKPQSNEKVQDYIIRQSSITRAMEYYCNQIDTFKPSEVLELAGIFENWVKR